MASKAGELKIFDLNTKQEVSNTKFDDTDYRFHILTLSHDDKYLLLSSAKENLHLVNVEDTKNPR